VTTVKLIFKDMYGRIAYHFNRGPRGFAREVCHEGLLFSLAVVACLIFCFSITSARAWDIADDICS
jgi:hypothetical protein